MALPQFTLKELLEAGVHFGHQTHRWNPKMKSYIYGERNGIHIIDLRQTVPALYRALSAVRQVAASGGRVLFVGSKRQAQDIVSETAGRCGQYYVNHRWLGGMLTNWKTINKSIRRLKNIEEIFAKPEESKLTKMELIKLQREQAKLQRALGGVKDMGGLPDAVFVIDTNREGIAIREANRLGIPVIAVMDSNSDPEGVDFPIPGNDDSTRAPRMYCGLVSDAVLDGISEQVSKVAPTAAKDAKTTSKKVVNLSKKKEAPASSKKEDSSAAANAGQA